MKNTGRQFLSPNLEFEHVSDVGAKDKRTISEHIQNIFKEGELLISYPEIPDNYL